MSPPDLLEVGRIDRPHGLGGDVLVRLVTNNPDRLVPGSTLLAVTDAGERSLSVVASRVHQDRWLVTFSDVSTRHGAESLAGSVLLAPAIADDPDSYWVHDLIGSVVTEPDGVERGVVTEVVANPASDILQLDSGALIPLRFVEWASDARPGSGTQPSRLVYRGPDGLFGDE